MNANPPWGLHELGLPMRATVSARWSVSGSDANLLRLRAPGLPASAIVRIRCTGPGCPFRRRTVAQPAGGSRNLLGPLGRAARQLHAGQALEVLVSAHAHDSKLFRWRLRNGRTPARVTRCIPLGNSLPRPHC